MSKLDELEAMQVAMKLVSERVRQIQELGYDAKHDDIHTEGELANASATYAITPFKRWTMEEDCMFGIWPWLDSDFKPSGDRVEDLVKAGALIIAEIQRLWRVERAAKMEARSEWLEEFEDIPGYEGRYQANGYGIKSLTNWKRGGMMTVWYNRFGTPYVDLTDKEHVLRHHKLDDLLKKP